MVRVSKSVTIKRPPEAVYEFWRQLENLPRFMYHLQDSVRQGTVAHTGSPGRRRVSTSSGMPRLWTNAPAS
jgi:uncharacterized membrane protein